MKTQLIFKYIGMGIIAMLLVMCEAGGDTDGGTITDISTYTLSYETTPKGTETTLSPTWNRDVANATYEINHTPIGTVIAPTIDTSTGKVSVVTATTGGVYTITATGRGSYSGTVTTTLTITVTPTSKAALTTEINAGIAAWGNEGDFNYINTENINDMSNLFQDSNTSDGTGYQLFNGNISKWNTSEVSSMLQMFAGASTFNQPIGDWNTSKVGNMFGMFNGASAFNQKIDKWNVGAVNLSSYIFKDSGMKSYPCWYSSSGITYPCP